MREEKAIRRRAAQYRSALAEALARRARQGEDGELDLLIITLIDKLEALLWALGVAEDDAVPLRQGPLH